MHCLYTVRGEKFPRSFGPTIHGTSPKDLVQYNYIVNVNDIWNSDKYVLTIQDNHADYKTFYASPQLTPLTPLTV